MSGSCMLLVILVLLHNFVGFKNIYNIKESVESDYIRLKAMKPAIAGYIRESQELMKKADFPDDKSVHDVRVLMKKARAVLRLATQQIDGEFVEREILATREVGRIMSSWRNTPVFRKILKDLKKKHPDLFVKLEDNDKLSSIMKKHDPDLTDDERNRLLQIDDILKKTGFRLRFEPMNNIDPGQLLKELEVTYNHVVNYYLICRNNPKRSNLHLFRKRSKDFLYQLWFFRPLNSPVIKELEKKLDVIAQNLGKYNDYAQLLKAIGYSYEYTANTPALDELAVLIREEQDKYLAKVWPPAYKIFCPGQRLENVLGFKLLLI
jgi:CHAD domain-containing protein